MRRKKDRSNGITALYERLSRDDDNAGESNSIVHQKQMLEDYAMKHGFTNLVHFTDDGWSGATFDRPSWNRLVEGVKNGEITACICKDMSRIGRDHLQVGFFTDILFREKEVRFIAINNGIDSDRQETSEFAPFLNIMNEWFVRDTSKKIKAVLKSRGSSGNAHTSNIPPYGYLKDPENPDHWIIDEEAAEVVRRIYRMTIEGKGPYQIARELSEEKIERPSYYLGKKGLGNHASNYDKENPYMWRGNQVTTLIARPEYIGKTVNFRTFKNSYKDKKTKRADKEDWVVFDDTQEPIVDEEFLNERIDVSSQYSYCLYTDKSTRFTDTRNHLLTEYWNRAAKAVSVNDYVIAENQHDAFMKYSDYCNLRAMLGLPQIPLSEEQYIIHCLPYLKDTFTNLQIEKGTLVCKDIFTEAFSQYGGYGNGQDFVIVVPDHYIENMEVMYSLYVVQSKAVIDMSELENTFPQVRPLNSNVVASGENGYTTKILDNGDYYYTGKLASTPTSQAILIILPLCYLSLVIGIISIVILAVQLLTEVKTIKRQYNVIRTFMSSLKPNSRYFLCMGIFTKVLIQKKDHG